MNTQEERTPQDTSRLIIVDYKQDSTFGYMVITKLRDKTDLIKFVVYHYNPQTNSFGHGKYCTDYKEALTNYDQRG